MKSKKYVGFELGKEDLKIVEVDVVSPGRYNISYYKNIPIPMLTLPGGEKTKERVVDWDILLNKLREELKGRSYANALASLMVPAKDAASSILTIPAIKGRDIVQFLEREIKKTSVIQEEINSKIEYLKLNDRTEKSGKVQDVLTILTDIDKLNDYYGHLSYLGIKSSVFTVKVYSLYSLVANLYPELSNVVLVDIGYELTSMVIIKGGQLKFVRSMYVTLGNIINLVSQELKVSEKDVENFLNSYGFDTDSYPKDEYAQHYKKSIGKFLDKLRAELQRSILFYQEKFGAGEKITKIVLTGAGLTVGKINEVLKSRLKLEVDILPFSNDVQSDDDFKIQYHLYASCLGCALVPSLKSRLNLMPKVEREKLGKRMHLEVAGVFLLIYATIYYIHIGYRGRLGSQEKQLSQLEFEIKNYPVNLDQEYQEISAKQSEYLKLEKDFQELQNHYIKWEDIFTELSKLIDPTMVISDFWIGFDKEKSMVFQIQGDYEGTYPDAQLTLRKVRLSLEESSMFENVKFEIKRSGKVTIGEVRGHPYTIAGYINSKILKKREL
ncbi:MAG: pilus assembly protein PilM [Candidatus Omnitrophica bacterium]|nr:pilus assembly protein PilM [Candidatus Omnitrophota bacterium]